jgi:hypothetical protein
MAGEGVALPLAGGETRMCRFSSRAIIKLENTYGSHFAFLTELDEIPLNTLGWVLLNCCGDIEGEDAAMDFLDGTDWPNLKQLVLAAWDQAHLPALPSNEPDPTEGQ